MKKNLLILILLLPTTALAQVLFQDDFDGSSLDSEWFTKPRPVTSPLGRTQTGPSPIIAGGIARLQFDTYNADAPGTLFLGTEILTLEKYSLDADGVQGLEFETSMRIDPSLPNGLVVGFFTFGRDGFNRTGDGGVGGFDEIDIEILSNLINEPITQGRTQEILINTFDGQKNGNIVELGPELSDISDINLSDFNTYTIRWFANKIEWFINDQVLFTLTELEGAAELADSEQGLHFNLWAPNSGFGLAFDSELTPTSNPERNESYFMEVDYVQITAIPEPGLFGFHLACMTGLGMLFLKRKYLFRKRIG